MLITPLVGVGLVDSADGDDKVGGVVGDAVPGLDPHALAIKATTNRICLVLIELPTRLTL